MFLWVLGKRRFHFNLNRQCKGERSRHGANSSHAADATASTLGGAALVLDDRSAPSSHVLLGNSVCNDLSILL